MTTSVAFIRTPQEVVNRIGRSQGWSDGKRDVLVWLGGEIYLHMLRLPMLAIEQGAAASETSEAIESSDGCAIRRRLTWQVR